MRGGRSKTLVRGWYGVVAGLVGFALVGQLILLARDHDSLVNYLGYFTIQSNIAVLVMSVIIVVDPERDDFLSQVVRLGALTAITITGVVYGTLIGPFVNPSGGELVLDRDRGRLHRRRRRAADRGRVGVSVGQPPPAGSVNPQRELSVGPRAPTRLDSRSIWPIIAGYTIRCRNGLIAAM